MTEEQFKAIKDELSTIGWILWFMLMLQVSNMIFRGN